MGLPYGIQTPSLSGQGALGREGGSTTLSGPQTAPSLAQRRPRSTLKGIVQKTGTG